MDSPEPSIFSFASLLATSAHDFFRIQRSCFASTFFVITGSLSWIILIVPCYQYYMINLLEVLLWRRACFARSLAVYGALAWRILSLPGALTCFLLGIDMANLSTKPSSRDDGLVAKLAISTNMIHKTYVPLFDVRSC